ncbi:MAG TPA: hypothetical protein PKA33_01490 [Amaricoccus sp.]|uniref:DUF7694 domain-containing protein n=1 Tax=Amaricoccus sp. TaxID=1872485 RepID=UPI002CBE3E1D|nr:hypothetical protein [Amaricoccus sp.]HMR51232.1 hypothetical protein [Amaricoccus sp.]HMT98019.1 hypothetical protein [Amaricoccus sp.]
MKDLSKLSSFATARSWDGGAYEIRSPRSGAKMMVVASNGAGWDHVSVSLRNRCPTWDEMERVKRMFFLPTETAMQLHVPPVAHISAHPYCLHLWRPQDASIPMPPDWMV